MFRASHRGLLRHLLRVLALSVALLHAGAYAQGLLALAESCHCTHPPAIPCDCPHMQAAGDDESKLPPCHRKLLQAKKAADKAETKVRNRCAPPPIAAQDLPDAVLSEPTELELKSPPVLPELPCWQPVMDHSAEPNAPPPRA